jgi:hypothetical protein
MDHFPFPNATLEQPLAGLLLRSLQIFGLQNITAGPADHFCYAPAIKVFSRTVPTGDFKVRVGCDNGIRDILQKTGLVSNLILGLFALGDLRLQLRCAFHHALLKRLVRDL